MRVINPAAVKTAAPRNKLREEKERNLSERNNIKSPRFVTTDNILVKTYVIRRLDRTGDECYATKEIPSKILGNPFCNIKNKEIEYFY